MSGLKCLLFGHKLQRVTVVLQVDGEVHEAKLCSRCRLLYLAPEHDE